MGKHWGGRERKVEARERERERRGRGRREGREGRATTKRLKSRYVVADAVEPFDVGVRYDSVACDIITYRLFYI